FFIALRNFLSDSFSLPWNSMLPTFTFSPLSIATTIFTSLLVSIVSVLIILILTLVLRNPSFLYLLVKKFFVLARKPSVTFLPILRSASLIRSSTFLSLIPVTFTSAKVGSSTTLISRKILSPTILVL